MTPNKQQISFC